jgi:16S rRNA processing protein RimM
VAHSTQGKITVVGKLTAVYGVKGWVKVHAYTEPMDNIFNFSPWFLMGADGNTTGKQVIIDDHRIHGKGLVAHIKGVDDRDAAALLCQRLIAVDMGELPTLPEGEYYWQELTGLQVLSRYSAGQPVLLGKISSLMETGANDVLVVTPCEGSIDQRERLLPYVEAYVLEVDLDTGTMLVDWDPEF